MNYFFNKVLDAIEQDVCYSQYSEYELIIQQAAYKLNAYFLNKGTSLEDIYLQEFLEECGNAQCDNAATALLGAITGNSGLFGCDMLEIMYNGDVNNGYYVGWRDQFTDKASYLLTLVNLGVTVQSSYITLESNNPDAWQVVQDQYGEGLATAGNRIKSFDQKCLDDWYVNAETNSYRLLTENADSGFSDEQMSDSISTTMNEINPYKLWLSNVYSNIGGFDNHCVICYDCIMYLHW